MSKHQCLLIALAMLQWVGSTAQPVYNYHKTFEVKSGYVEYHNYYDDPPSTIKFWWDDYGQKYREEFITNGMINSINLANGKYYYTINLKTQKGSEVLADVAIQVQAYYESMHFTNARGFETILGYECQTTETAGIITSAYKGIPLRVSEGSGYIVQDAMRFEKNAIIGPEIFLLPNNILVEDVTEDLKSEMMPKFDPDDEYNSEPLQVSISYEQFIEAGKRICRELNYEPISEYALNDMYSSCYGIYTNDNVSELCFQISVLSNYTSIPNWTFGEGRELLYHNGRRFIYYTYLNYDEEMGTQSQASNLTIEMSEENIIFDVYVSPEKTKEEMISLFDALGF